MHSASAAAILFPGQGSSVAGARPLVEQHCARLHEQAVELLGTDPLEHALETTSCAQPAIFLASLAGWRAIEAAGVTPFAFAGHSLGELSALTAAGAFTPEEGLRLVLLRGALMDEVARSSGGGMLAILKGTVEQAEQLALAHGLGIANYNAPGQTVLSGATDALEAATREARSLGLRALRLSVSGAFHTPAFMPARVAFQEALREIEPKPTTVPVMSSMTAQPFTDLVTELAAALTEPVRWTATMRALEEMGAPAYLDAGPDRVLERLAGRNLGEVVLIDRDELHVHA